MKPSAYLFLILLLCSFCQSKEQNQSTSPDYQFEAILDSLSQASQYIYPKEDLIEIDCNQISVILNNVFKTDQEVRMNGGDMEKVDQINQQTIISILEKCGMPSTKTVGIRGIDAIFLVLQHSPKNLMSLYYPEIKRLVKIGDLSRTSFALMQDRLLMYYGYPQIYGSQIKNGELYYLYMPECVNERRAEIGLGNMEEYLEHFGLNFETEILKMTRKE